MEALQIIFPILGLVAPIFTLIVVNSIKTNQSHMDSKLAALKEQGAIRGEHLESKITDVKMYVKEVIEDVKNDFAELKSDVGQRQMIEDGLKQQILKEIHDLSMKFEVIKKDVNIVQGLYDKRIEHESEVKEALDEMKWELDGLKKKLRGVENKQKGINKVLKHNDITLDDED